MIYLAARFFAVFWKMIAMKYFGRVRHLCYRDGILLSEISKKTGYPLRAIKL
jgi:hypothetical protein